MTDFVYMDIAVEGDPIGRVIFELVSQTADLFWDQVSRLVQKQEQQQTAELAVFPQELVKPTPTLFFTRTNPV